MTKDRGSAKLETEIQKEICLHLFSLGLLFWRCNNVKSYMHRSTNKDITPDGLPDIFVLHNGELYALEVKRPGAALRDSQERMRDRMLANGAHYYTVTSVEEVKDISVIFT